MEQIRALISKIKTYTYADEHPELKRAHHFNFDIRTCPHNDVQFVVMGLNPADSEADDIEKREPNYKCKEISSIFDSRKEYIHSKYGSREILPWNKKIKEILPEDAGFTQTERFFWSSYGGVKQFQKHFETTLHRSKHLNFCKDINTALVEIYKPKAVICLGTSQYGLNALRILYDLTDINTEKRNGKKLVVHCHDKNGRDWIFVPHLTGTRSFSSEDKKFIKDYLQDISKKIEVK